MTAYGLHRKPSTVHLGRYSPLAREVQLHYVLKNCGDTSYAEATIQFTFIATAGNPFASLQEHLLKRTKLSKRYDWERFAMPWLALTSPLPHTAHLPRKVPQLQRTGWSVPMQKYCSIFRLPADLLSIHSASLAGRPIVIIPVWFASLSPSATCARCGVRLRSVYLHFGRLSELEMNGGVS